MSETRDERDALDTLKELERPVAPDEARERIRGAFLAATPAGRGRRWALPGLLAAAAVILLVAYYGLRPAEEWVVTDVSNPGAVRSPVADDLTPGARLPGGAVSTGPASELELTLGPALRIRILPGTDAVLPSAPWRLLGRPARLRVTRGEVYGTTGGEPPGFTLVLETEEASGQITGTTFAVFRTDEATCFCLLSGGIEVTPRAGGPAIAVPLQQRVFVYRDGRPPRLEPITDMERMKLSMIREAGTAEAP